MFLNSLTNKWKKKNMIANLNSNEKLNGDNYDIWHWKFQYMLKEQDVFEPLTQTIWLILVRDQNQVDG